MLIYLKNILVVSTILGFVTSAVANPLCASPDQKLLINNALKETPNARPAKLARALGLSEAAVVHGFPAEMRVPINPKKFENIWQSLTRWQDALIIVPSSGSVFELFGPLPAGTTDHGYFNFDSPNSPYGGHLKTERLAAIYLLSTAGRNGEAHQAAFYDYHGNRVFSVYVPRDAEDNLKTQPYEEFLSLKNEYDIPQTKTTSSDARCL